MNLEKFALSLMSSSSRDVSVAIRGNAVDFSVLGNAVQNLPSHTFSYTFASHHAVDFFYFWGTQRRYKSSFEIRTAASYSHFTRAS